MTPTGRVPRLRRRITALFALTSAVGLVTMAVLAVRSDDTRWREQLDQAMNLDTTQAISLLTYDAGDRLDTTDLVGTMDTGCPQLTVLAVPRDGSSGPVVDFAGERPCLVGRPADVRAVAETALRREEAVAVDGRAADGRRVRLFAEPFFAPDAEGEEGRDGAVVTLYETTEALADHRRTTWLLAAGCAVLVVLSAAVGHVLSGRAIRPALTALGQQEAFLADAAHDLRTPVASLRMLAETQPAEARTRASAAGLDSSYACPWGLLRKNSASSREAEAYRTQDPRSTPVKRAVRSRPVLVLAVAVLGVAALSACTAPEADGRGRGVDPAVRGELRAFYTQKLKWTGCGEFRCARLTVPMDYADPGNGRTFELAVAKAVTADPARRMGSLVFNPGGPGGSGVDHLKDGAADSFGAKVRERFDIVSFDPRGVGASTPALTCDDVAGAEVCPGATPDAIRTVIDRLFARTARAPLPVDGSEAGADERTLLDALSMAMYTPEAQWKGLSEALSAADAGDGTKLVAPADGEDAPEEEGEEEGGGRTPGEEAVPADNEDAALLAVNCADTPHPRSAQPYWDALAPADRAAGPYGTTSVLDAMTCKDLPAAAGQPHRVRAEGVPPVLVVGTTGDPATPYEESESLAAQFPGGMLLTYEGVGHTAYGRGGSCVTDAVDAYLVTLKPVRAGATCQ